MNFYYSIDGSEPQGPYSMAELQHDFRSGTLPPSTQICIEGTQDWKSIKTLPKPAIVPVAIPEQKLSQSTFCNLLGKYTSQVIGINCKEPKKYHSARLVGVADEYFSVFVSDTAITIHYPYSQIVHVIEANGGISTGIVFTKQFPVVIEVMQLIVYSGGVGLSIPI